MAPSRGQAQANGGPPPVKLEMPGSTRNRRFEPVSRQAVAKRPGVLACSWQERRLVKFPVPTCQLSWTIRFRYVTERAFSAILGERSQTLRDGSTNARQPKDASTFLITE